MFYDFFVKTSSFLLLIGKFIIFAHIITYQMKKNFSLLSVFLIFLVMGFGDAANQLVSIVQTAFDITPFMASFVSFFGMVMFGVLSIPTGVMQSRIGKKKMLLIGLVIFLLGAVLPTMFFNFPIVLASVMFMGAGATILQVSGNPMMQVVSQGNSYSSNLSFAQAVKAIGTMSTSALVAIVGTSLMKYAWFNPTNSGINMGFRILFPIFAIIIIITMIMTKVFVPADSRENLNPTTLSKCFKTLKNRYILMMFLAIFFYCGAEASMFNRIPSLLQNNAGISASIGNIVIVAALFAGRMTGGIILRKIKPSTFFIITLIISVIGNIMLFLPYNSITIWLAFILIGIGFANIFPLVFSICISRYNDLADEISGLMTTAIVGAAFVPLLTGLAATINNKYAFIVTLACLVYLSVVAGINKKTETKTA